jgi:hypothetical protein
MKLNLSSIPFERGYLDPLIQLIKLCAAYAAGVWRVYFVLSHYFIQERNVR